MWKRLNSLSRQLGLGTPRDTYAMVLSGGGARAAYQAGVLLYIAEKFEPEIPEIITGVSAGSINAGFVANETGTFRETAARLVECWKTLEADDVYIAESSFRVFWKMLRQSGDADEELFPRSGLVDTDPLRIYLKRIFDAPDGRLSGIPKNIASGRLRACAFVSTNYTTAQTVTWVEGDDIPGWERPNRVSEITQLTVEHIMGSTSLPFLFPAIALGENGWFGDGGIRQSEPLSPAVHLGADRILAISTRYGRSQREASIPSTTGYPPAAQIFSVLLNAVFLDRMDQDAVTLRHVNDLVKQMPRWRRSGMRPIDLFVIRPSKDLGRLAADFQHDLKGILKLIARGLGSGDTESPDWLSMILFEPGYMDRLIQIGYDDARVHAEQLGRFLDPDIPWSVD